MKRRFWVGFLALLLGIVFTFQMIPGQGAEMPMLGDVDGNGTVDTTDARLALQAAMGKLTLTEEQKQRADVCGDGVIDTTAARLILQYALGKITEFPAGTASGEDTTTTTTATPSEPGLSQYPVREVNEMPEGTEITINHAENLGYVPGWEPSAAAIVTSVDELQNCGIELPETLIQKYDAAFFEDSAILFMAMPVGHANINHQIDSLVRIDNDLCLNTTITWTGGLDVTVRVTWRFAFEVSKADVAGVEKVNRYTFDEKDNALEKSQQPPDINRNFSDNEVLITLKRSYSTVGGQFTLDDFLGLDVESVRNLNQYSNPTVLEQISSDGEYNQTILLTFTIKNKQYIIEAISELLKMDIIFDAQPSYIYGPA